MRLTGAQERRWVRATGRPSGEARAPSGRPSEMPAGQSAAQAAGHGAASPSWKIYLCQSRISDKEQIAMRLLFPAPVYGHQFGSACACCNSSYCKQFSVLLQAIPSDKKHILSESYARFPSVITEMHKTSWR